MAGFNVFEREINPVLFEEEIFLKKIILNKPRKLNSLSYEMIHQIFQALKSYETDSRVKIVILKGNGKSFCAGGDLIKCVQLIIAGNWRFAAEFHRLQFSLDYLISTYAKPVVVIIDGVVMGGGAGISMPGKFRIVTENTVFAMPEASIGHFPDVGASYFLSRLPGHFGEYLALTGAKVDGFQMLSSGLATHFVLSKDLPALENELHALTSSTPTDISLLINKFTYKRETKQDTFTERFGIINKCFSKTTVEEILFSLEKEVETEEKKWLFDAISFLKSASPMSLKLSLRSVREGRKETLESCLAREFIMSSNVVRRIVNDDFYEGVKTFITQKDQKPKLTRVIDMAYVPPHKRLSKDAGGTFPKPELLTPQFCKNKTFRPYGPEKILYAKGAISRLSAVYLEDDSHLLSALRLQPISIDIIQNINPMMLVCDNNLVEDKTVIRDKSPWDSIADQLVEDLLHSYENLKKVEGYEVEEVMPKLAARFGKVLFHGKPSVDLETEKSVHVDENTLTKMKRLFRTNVPTSYVKSITDEVVSRIKLDFEEEKELYHVKVSDSNVPEYTITCKCIVMKGSNKLELYKLEASQVRHMVADMFCLPKDLDLRLMLCSKKYLSLLKDDENNNIDSLIRSAIIDSSVKGGLRWSLGTDSSEDRYRVVGVWHTISKTFTSPSIKLEIINADRFNFLTSSGEVTNEVTLKLKGILSHLREKIIQPDVIAELLKEDIKLIWDNFLRSDSPIN